MLQITSNITIPLREIEWSAVRAQGAGGQNVNKVSSAVHLRFDIPKSSLNEFCKGRLLALGDARITSDGVLVIKAQRFRTQERNRADALARLQEIVLSAIKTSKPRFATKPTRGSQVRRMDSKNLRGQVKQARRKIILD